MSLQVSLARQGPVLAVKGSGPANLADLKGFADMMATVCREEQLTHVLVDLLDVQQQLTFTEHLQLGVYLAERLHFLTKMASVVPEQMRSGNSERAAQKSGLQIRTFTDMGEARDWLKQPD
ncbi:STAS/SEC14 domain-containing protein [Ramlibacter sp. PS4R-6]|uniref:STAS/SEC14 domain-containing protein n=1 Tax=Ramlibacter sp. PS4R-6 TaxID=3133438 RepID=UPI00309AF740